jgi:hypothetical protein
MDDLPAAAVCLKAWFVVALGRNGKDLQAGIYVEGEGQRGVS